MQVANVDFDTVVFAVLSMALWLSPVAVIVAAVRIARHFDIDLRRHPPPDDIDYKKW
jgi:hypothetical protein